MNQPAVTIRPASLADVHVVAEHRLHMFDDMRVLPEHLHASMLSESIIWTGEMMTEGTYLGWLATPETEPERVVAGVGALLRAVPPTVTRGEAPAVRTGLQALVINVYVEPHWRRRGVARLLMHECIAALRRHDVMNIVLHASDEARALYQSLGFVATNEMRLT